MITLLYQPPYHSPLVLERSVSQLQSLMILYQRQLNDLSSRITVDVPGGSVLIIDNDDGRCIYSGAHACVFNDKHLNIDLPCQAHSGVSEVTISCSGIGPETPLQCSFDGGPLHSCK